MDAEPAPWRALADLQHGVVARDQLIALGHTRSPARQNVVNGRWQLLLPGVYATFTGPVGPLDHLRCDPVRRTGGRCESRHRHVSWSVLHALVPVDLRDAVWLAVLDVFWPLSMLGMFVIGIKVAVAGRWTGLLRVWPLIAESWAIVVLPIMGIFGPAIGGPAAGLHLLLGYGVLGLLLVGMPERTRAS